VFGHEIKARSPGGKQHTISQGSHRNEWPVGPLPLSRFLCACLCLPVPMPAYHPNGAAAARGMGISHVTRLRLVPSSPNIPTR
jgi:hypothetical protein